MAATSCHPNIGRHLNVSRASGGVNVHCERWNEIVALIVAASRQRRFYLSPFVCYLLSTPRNRKNNTTILTLHTHIEREYRETFFLSFAANGKKRKRRRPQVRREKKKKSVWVPQWLRLRLLAQPSSLSRRFMNILAPLFILLLLFSLHLPHLSSYII